MATIKEVAAAANVSIATVSHVINGTRYVSDELKARVSQSMETLGYQPNSIARSLRSGQTKTIGMIVPDASNLYFAEIARAIEDVGYENGYSVILCNSDNNPEKQHSYNKTLIEKQIDGLIFISVGAYEEDLALIKDANIPIVVFDRFVPPDTADVVLVDNRMGGRLAASHLIELGHHEVGCITGPEELPSSSDRVEGFLQLLRRENSEPPPEWLQSGDFQIQSGDSCMTRILDQPERPSAVFVCNDMMAIGAMNAIHRRGLRIPGDISIVGFDDIALSAAVHPPLTTVAQPITDLAATTCELLFNRMLNTDERGPTRSVILHPQLVIRASTMNKGMHDE
jgi:LacI family transcriptional regulator